MWWLLALAALQGVLRGIVAVSELNITVPSTYSVQGNDAYVCVIKELPKEPHKLVGVLPLADATIVHHILLFGCTKPLHTPEPGKAVAWECVDHHHVCAEGNGVLYGWGRNAPTLHLPEGVGYSVGEGTNIVYLVTQVHFKAARPPDDVSGVTLLLRQEPTPLAAGMMAFAAHVAIPPDTASTKVPVACCYQGHQPVTTLAFRVHAHSLGRSITMTRANWTRPEVTEQVATNDPQLPQAFYPVHQQLIWPGDWLTVTCDYDSRGRHRPTFDGPTAEDEMCNMYMMVYAPHPYLAQCNGGSEVMRAPEGMPGTMRTDARWQLDPCLFWQPPALADGSSSSSAGALPAAAASAAKVAPGDLTGVALGGDGTLWALYRGNHPWQDTTFDAANRMQDRSLISTPVLLQLDPDTGQVMQRLGAGLFSLPHMVTLDREGHIWVVDVGLHMVLKLDRTGKVLLSVGTKLTPGADKSHFCKPTHVAVARDGSFYVADGYCNSRVVKFDAKGNYIGELAVPPPDDPTIPNVIHSVLLDECTQQLFIAAREVGKVYVGVTDELKVVDFVSLAQNGKVWSLLMGPYGTAMALVWDTGKDAVLAELWSDGAEPRSWVLPGLTQTAVHQAALGAAPPQLSGAADRLFALYVASTCCEPLLRYVLVPHGLQLPDASALRTPQRFDSSPPAALEPDLPAPPRSPPQPWPQPPPPAPVKQQAAAGPRPTSSPSRPSVVASGPDGAATTTQEVHGTPTAQAARPGAEGPADSTQAAGSGGEAVSGADVGVGGQEPQPGVLHVVAGVTGLASGGWQGKGGWAMRILAFVVFACVGATVGFFASRKLLTRKAELDAAPGHAAGGQHKYHKADIDELLARSAQLDEGLEEGSATHTQAAAANGSKAAPASRHYELPMSPFALATSTAAAISHLAGSHHGRTPQMASPSHAELARRTAAPPDADVRQSGGAHQP